MLFVLSGPSYVGKKTALSHFMKLYSFSSIIPYTTKPLKRQSGEIFAGWASDRVHSSGRLSLTVTRKLFLVFILFLTWLNYLLSYEYVKIMMDTADASKVSNTIVLLIFPIMWNYGAAIIKIISSIAVIIITLIYQTNEYVDIRKICYSSDDSLIWKIVSILFYIAIVLFEFAICKETWRFIDK